MGGKVVCGPSPRPAETVKHVTALISDELITARFHSAFSQKREARWANVNRQSDE
jgi:hypothetical protein